MTPWLTPRRQGGASTRRAPLLLLVTVLIAALAVAPVIQLSARALRGGGGALALVLRPRAMTLTTNTISLTVVVCAACLVLGVAVAYATTQLRLPAPRLWLMLACLPLALPSFIAAFAWTATFPQVTGFWPLVLVLTLTSVPLVTVPTIGAFAVADHGLADVARTLGRGRLRTFGSVMLPQILPAALAGTLLVALYTIADFGAPAILRHPTLTTGVHALFSAGGGLTAAAAAALPLIALALLCTWGERRLRGRVEREERAGRTRRQAPPPRSRREVTVAIVALSTLAVASVAAPAAALVVRALRADRYGTVPADLATSALTTLALGFVAATVAVILALPVATLGARFRGRFVAVVEAAVYVGHGIPGVVLALALVALSLAYLPVLYQTVVLLLAAYVILHLVLAVGPSRSALLRVPVPAQEVSRTLGRGPAATWWRVTLPAALPGVAAGWLLVAAAVMKELPATLMLRPTGLDTLATELWSKTSIGAYGAAAPIGILLVVVGLAPALLLARSLRGRIAS